MYFYNLETGILHIEGFCGQSNPHPYHIKRFNTEREAYDFLGRHKIQICLNCQEKRDKILKEGWK